MIAPHRTLGGYQAWSDVWIRSGWRVQRHATTGTHRLLDPANRCHMTGAPDACLDAARRSAPSAGYDRAVILLHGMGRWRRLMAPLEAALRRTGWATANVGYASLRSSFEDHVAAISLIARALHEDGARQVALVGHSLGGLIARAAMAHAAQEGWTPGRLVLLGSPARGAALADRLLRYRVYRALSGDCGLAVAPARAARVPMPDAEIGVIAGGTGGHGYNPLLQGDNDLVVTVAETRLWGAEADFLRLPVTHAFLARHKVAITAVCGFLETGRFPAIAAHAHTEDAAAAAAAE